MSTPRKNTRRAAMDAERLDWRCFRFVDDKRQWKQLAQERRAFFVKAANSANEDGTHVEISVGTFAKAAGRRRTAFNRLDDLADMGACLPVLHTDARGKVREMLTEHGTKVRRLMFGALEAAQAVLDSGQEFLGHTRLSDAEKLAIQKGWTCKGAQNSGNGVQNWLGEGVQKSLQTSAEVALRSAKDDVKECNVGLHTTEGTEGTETPSPMQNKSAGDNFPGGKFAENQNAPQDETLTIETLWVRLQERYASLREEASEVPAILPSTGRERVLAAYKRRGAKTEDDLYDLGLLDTFDRWFWDRFVPSYESKKRQPILSPMTLYADEGFAEFDARPKRAA